MDGYYDVYDDGFGYTIVGEVIQWDDPARIARAMEAIGLTIADAEADVREYHQRWE